MQSQFQPMTQTVQNVPTPATPPGTGTTRPQAAQFDGSIPELYDRCLGPVLFDFSARDLSARIARRVDAGAQILEIACGTGIATEHIWRAAPASSHLTATDLNQAMLDIALERRGHLSGVTYQQADACDLPFKPSAFDVVVCQFGTMFFPDKMRGIAEMTRVLKPGGTLLFNVWDSLDENPAVKTAQRTIASAFEHDRPRFLDVPFGDHHCHTNRQRLLDAGLVNVEIAVVAAMVDTDVGELARGLVCGTPGILEIRERSSVDPDDIVRSVAAALEREFGGSRCRLPFQEFVFCATRPAA